MNNVPKTFRSIDDRFAVSFDIGTLFVYEGKPYINKIVDGDVVWVEIVNPEDIPDEFLDQFQPSNHTFFLIGNPEVCKPCKEALDIFDHLLKTKEITYKKWLANLETKRPESFLKYSWTLREKKKDDKYKDYDKFPQIWYKGEFIGGLNDLKSVLKEEFSQ